MNQSRKKIGGEYTAVADSGNNSLTVSYELGGTNLIKNEKSDSTVFYKETSDSENDIINEIVHEYHYKGDDGQDIIHYSYKLPKINQDTGDAKKWNDAVDKLISETYKGSAEYDKVEWNCNWNGDVVSIIVSMKFAFSPLVKYKAFNYNTEKGVEISIPEFLKLFGTDEKHAESAIRRAACQRFDDNSKAVYEVNGAECFGELMVLRARTISEININTNINNLPLFIYNDGSLRTYVDIWTPAGAGYFTEEICPDLNPEKGPVKNVKCDFISAELNNNEITLEFKNTGLAGLYVHGDTVEFDKPYKLEGLYGEYTDIGLGFVGNGGYAYLFITDSKGRVSYCNIMNGMDCRKFFAVGPVPEPLGVKSYECGKNTDGDTVFAITDEGKVDLSKIIASTESFVPSVFDGEVWESENGDYTFSSSGDAPIITWGGGGGVLATGLSLNYMGMTKNGLVFFFLMEEEGGGNMASGYVTLRGDGNQLTLNQVSGKLLPGIPSDGEIKLFRNL